MSTQFCRAGLLFAQRSDCVSPVPLIKPSYGFGLTPASCSPLAWSSVVSVSVTSVAFGSPALIDSANCFAETLLPARKTMFTPSVFHFSMKLSTWAWAAVVSVPVMLRMAVEPVLALAFLSAGTITSFTRLSLFLSPTTATVLPLSLPVLAIRLMSAAATCSLVRSGVSISPAGEASIHGWSSSCPMWMTLCSLVRHCWP